jgi:hypothetical protein
MLYALLCYASEEEWKSRDRPQRARIMEAHIEEANLANANGKLVTSMRLLRTDAATTIRRTESGIAVVDGPFAETREQLGGLHVLDCDHLDEAIAYARMYVAHGGTVEIRPLHPEPMSLD